MDAIIPRKQLLDAWAAQARCPVCQGTPLRILRQPEQPDQMACPRCGSSFELEDGGTHLRLKKVPPFLHVQLVGRWLTVGEVARVVQQVAAQQNARPEKPTETAPQPAPPLPPPAQSAQPPAALEIEPAPPQPSTPQPLNEEFSLDSRLGGFITPPPEPAVPEAPAPQPPAVHETPPVPSAPTIDALTRARELYKLGNSPNQIRAILARDPHNTPAEIDVALNDLTSTDKQKRKQQNKTVSTILWVCLGLLLLLAVGGFLLRAYVLNTAPTTPSANPQETNSLPAIVLGGQETLAPDSRSIENLVPTIVAENAAGQTVPACPKTKEQAATLFGGPAQSWNPDLSATTWYMVTNAPQKIHVPKGMKAIILLGSQNDPKNVTGPATIQDIASLSISCR